MSDRMDELLTGFYKFQKEMKSEFAAMGERMESLEKKVDNLDSRVGSLEDKVDNLDRRVGGFEDKVDNIEKNNKKIFEKLKEHDKHFHNIESRLFTIKRISAENSLEIGNIRNNVV